MKQALKSKVTITLPDGATRDYDAGVTAYDIAHDISPGLAKAVIAARINGELSDLSLPINDDAKLELLKRDAPEALELIRHDCAHVMAEAVQKLFPGTQVTIGPNIENGFFYDFARNEPFSSEDLSAIEKEMRKIIERGDAFVREVWARDEAIAYFKNKGEAYKAELIEDLPESEEIKIYKQGEWLDLCRGPHMPSTKHVGSGFKLLKVAGAYWRGDSDKAMLTRIYGTAWRDQKELDAYLHQLEEAEKRDHRKLGAEMDLFHFQPEAQGSVFWHPAGFTIYNQMEGYIRRRLKNAGYKEIKTPQLIDNKLWEKSGHWGKYRENMFVVPDEVPQGSDDAEHDGPILSDKAFEKLMALKPMNCPAHVQVFNQGLKSYRDLPIRLAEFGCCHRNEAHGALHGLMRVRQFTQDDAHIFCTEDQITDEAVAFCDLLKTVYSDLGFDDVAVALSLRPETRVGDDALWDKAEEGLRKALVKTGLEFREDPGEGAFYGPKIDYQIRDAIGRTWQCGTLQLDFNLPQRLEASYIGPDGEKHRPVMLHRAILGSLERFIGVMIENYAGKLPLWLAPTQVVVATITDKADDYAAQLHKKLLDAGLRAELDVRNEKINYKVREHSHAKVPYIYVVGAKESEEGTVAIRQLGGKDQVMAGCDDAIQDLVSACKPPY